MAWGLPDEASVYADEVLIRMNQVTAIVPRLWPFEVANALLVGERRSRIAVSETLEFIRRLAGLGIVRDDAAAPPIELLAAIGRDFGATGYDAAYLELARRHGLPLATLDKGQQAAATRMGLGLLDVG